MSDIVKRLNIKAGVMEMGELIAWGSDTALMREAAASIEAKDKRIAELEAEVRDKVEGMLERGAEIRELRKQLADYGRLKALIRAHIRKSDWPADLVSVIEESSDE